MPMLGVIRETFDKEGGSIRGEDDFFSVARTMPLVAARVCINGTQGKSFGALVYL